LYIHITIILDDDVPGDVLGLADAYEATDRLLDDVERLR
jgi:hypothetical protein